MNEEVKETIEVAEETKVTKEETKNAVISGIKLGLGCAASIGAGAVIGFLLRNQDYTRLKGLGKIFAGVGISGLALAAGNTAGEAVEKQVDDICETVQNVEAFVEGLKE